MKIKRSIKMLAVCLTFCIIASVFSFSASANTSDDNKILLCQEVVSLPDGGKIYVYNIDGIINEFPVPPNGFDPLEATDATLEMYGFPPRPTDNVQLLEWTKRMKNYKSTPIPKIERTDIVHSVNRPVPSSLSQSSNRALESNTTSYNWSGYVAKGKFSQVQGDFIQPTINTSEPSYTHESTWVGLGGYYANSSLVQTGTAMTTYQGGRHYYAWYEYLSSANPNPEIRMNSVTVNPGDRIHAYCSFQKSNNKFNAYIANDTNGTSQSVLISISASEYFDQRTAEFINEHPSWGVTDNGLTNYGVTNWTNCKVFTLTGGSWVNLGSTTYDRVTMINNNNAVMAEPSNLSGTSFINTWRRRN